MFLLDKAEKFTHGGLFQRVPHDDIQLSTKFMAATPSANTHRRETRAGPDPDLEALARSLPQAAPPYLIYPESEDEPAPVHHAPHPAVVRPQPLPASTSIPASHEIPAKAPRSWRPPHRYRRQAARPRQKESGGKSLTLISNSSVKPHVSNIDFCLYLFIIMNAGASWSPISYHELTWRFSMN